MSDFLWGLENSGWLRHIKAIMDAGSFIAKVRNGEKQKWRYRKGKSYLEVEILLPDYLTFLPLS